MVDRFRGIDYLVDEVDDRINRERVLIMFYENRIVLKDLLDPRNDLPNEAAKFNYILGIIKVNYHINIYQTLVYLMDEGYEMKSLVEILDEDSRKKIEQEMKDIFRIKGVREGEVDIEDFLV